jgi:hypothetical protein
MLTAVKISRNCRHPLREDRADPSKLTELIAGTFKVTDDRRNLYRQLFDYIRRKLLNRDPSLCLCIPLISSMHTRQSSGLSSINDSSTHLNQNRFCLISGSSCADIERVHQVRTFYWLPDCTSAAAISVFSRNDYFAQHAFFSRLSLVDQCMAALTHTGFE